MRLRRRGKYPPAPKSRKQRSETFALELAAAACVVLAYWVAPLFAVGGVLLGVVVATRPRRQAIGAILVIVSLAAGILDYTLALKHAEEQTRCEPSVYVRCPGE